MDDLPRAEQRTSALLWESCSHLDYISSADSGMLRIPEWKNQKSLPLPPALCGTDTLVTDRRSEMGYHHLKLVLILIKEPKPCPLVSDEALPSAPSDHFPHSWRTTIENAADHATLERLSVIKTCNPVQEAGELRQQSPIDQLIFN